jgi:hypothetical protein
LVDLELIHSLLKAVASEDLRIAAEAEEGLSAASTASATDGVVRNAGHVGDRWRIGDRRRNFCYLNGWCQRAGSLASRNRGLEVSFAYAQLFTYQGGSALAVRREVPVKIQSREEVAAFF